MLGDGGQAAEPIKTDSPDSILAMFGRRDVSNVDLSARTSRIESWRALESNVGFGGGRVKAVPDAVASASASASAARRSRFKIAASSRI